MKARAVTSIVSKAFCGLMLLLSPIFAFGQDSTAEALYKAGTHALNTMPHASGPERDRHLAEAKENLSQSFEKLKNPMTAYALAFLYTLSYDYANAKIYAKKALTLEPKLSSDFLSEAQKILEWAQANEIAIVDMKFHAVPPPSLHAPRREREFLFKRPAKTIRTKSSQKV